MIIWSYHEFIHGFYPPQPELKFALPPSRRFPLDVLQAGLHILVGGRRGGFSQGSPDGAGGRDHGRRGLSSGWRRVRRTDSGPGNPPQRVLVAHPVQLAHMPHRNLRKKVPRVDGSLTMQPRTPTVPPARSASAASMQSPPASAEAASVSRLSPMLARHGTLPRRM